MDSTSESSNEELRREPGYGEEVKGPRSTLCPSQQNTSFEQSRVSPLGQSFTGILHGAWSRFPMGLVTVNEQTLASCLSSPLSPQQPSAGWSQMTWRWGGKSQYLEGKLKLPAQSKPLLKQQHPSSAPNTNPHSPCCRL